MAETPPTGSVGHETTDAELKPIALFFVGLGVLLVAVFLGMGLAFDLLTGAREAAAGAPSTEFDRNQLPPTPRLQAIPAEDLDALRQRDAEALSTYRWIDREAGRLEIPIERAMELLLEDGLPVRPSGAEGEQR